MTVELVKRRAGPFTGNGSTTDFPFDFKVFEESDIVVTRTVSADDSTELTLELNTDYTVTLNEDQNSDAGGYVVLNAPLEEGVNLAITSDIPETQEIIVTNAGRFYPATFNDVFDKLTILIQQLSEQIERTLVVPITSIETPEAVMNNMLNIAATANEYAAQAQQTYQEVLQTQTEIVGIQESVTADREAVEASKASVDETYAAFSELTTQYGSAFDDVSALLPNIGSVTTVASSIDNINTVANDLSAGSETSSIATVAENIANVNAVADQAADIDAYLTTFEGYKTAAETAQTGAQTAQAAAEAAQAAAEEAARQAQEGSVDGLPLVRYEAQSLTADEQAIARSNIGLGGLAVLDTVTDAELAAIYVKASAAQTLTTDQQKQARTNIGAVAESELVDVVRVSEQTLTEEQQTQARANIDAAISTILPVGTMITFAGQSVPTGFLICNGAEVSRETYADLFAVIGVIYGEGDGSSTFNLPDLNGRVLQGVSDTSGVGTYLEAQLPNITGQVFQMGSNLTIRSGAFANTFANRTGATSITGSGQDEITLDFNANSASSIYSGTTVQPSALQSLVCIRY